MAPKQPVAGPSRQKMSSTASSPPPHPSISSFNPSRTHFATATPVLGSADRLQVWDVALNRVIAEWDVEGASKVTTICWTSIHSDAGSSGSRNKKKRRQQHSAASALVEGGEEEVVVITTAKGELVVFSPTSGTVKRKSDLPAPVTAAWSSEQGVILATATSLLILSSQAAVSHSISLPANTPSPTAVAILPTSSTEVLHVLVGSSSVITLHLELSSSTITHTSSSLPVSTSSVTSLRPLPTSSQGSSFLVVAEDDRTISQYTSATSTSPAKLSYRYASPTLSPAHSISISSTLVSVLHSSGEISLFTIPSELDFTRPKTDSKPCTVKLVEGKDERIARLCRVAFSSGDQSSGRLICGQMAGGGRIKWVTASYEQPEGGMKPSTVVKVDAQDLVGASAGSSTIPLQRITTPNAGAQVPETETNDEPASALPTDVDMADLSLGERLLALPNGTTPTVAESSAATKPSAVPVGPVTAGSLTRLLVQALHTSDPALLTLCLTHRDPVLIRNTIRKMPAQMALPLLKACVERLGQGKGANRRGGGRGSVQSEQQGRGTVEWVKGVLVERGAILMTIPSLPLHLATLSQLLQTRLQLHQPLLSLSGRLDLALAQITMRRIAAEQAAAALSGGNKGINGDGGHKYVEGDSDDEDEDVVVETGDGNVEVEDIDMRAGGSDKEDEDSEDSDDSDNEDDDEEDEDEDPLESGSEDGLVELEAEESDEEESGSEED